VSTFFSCLIVGLRLGSIYALVALGYTMVYGIIRLINFAHGDFIMVGGYALVLTMPLLLGLHIPPWSAVVIAIIACVIVGILVELLAYRPVRKKGTNMTALITAIAMSLLLENLAQVIFGSNPRISSKIFGEVSFKLGSVPLDLTMILTIVISAIVMAGLYFFTQKTKIGRAMRAVSEDKQAAVLMGINVNRTIVMTFAIGSALAAVAALMYVAQYPKVETTMGVMLGLKAFVAAVLGGIGSIPGAMLGGFVIGIVESVAAAYINPGLADAIVFLILIVALILKPAGILGKNVGEKV